MRYILFILLFFTCTAKAQITILQHYVGTSTTDLSSYGFFPTSADVGQLIILIVTSTKATTPDIPAPSGMGVTWDQIITETSATQRITMFRGIVTSATSNITIGFSGATQTGCAISICKITGYFGASNGADAIVQSVSDQDVTANPVVTMAAISSGSNAVIASFGNNANPFAGTPESEWTELDDVGYATPSTGLFSMYRLTTTDNTPTVTASSSDWLGIAVEIKSLTRRRIIID